jgi:2-keto-4-pentenoate hydratase/2-oxohepta-3-ene-1,7-dioic acid hydratase in catechol pathway
MRLCRYAHQGQVDIGLYDDKFVIPLAAAGQLYSDATHDKQQIKASEDLLDYLPPGGRNFAAAKAIAAWVERNAEGSVAKARLTHDAVELLVPVPRPNKLLLLAGNYNEHIQEGGGAATERAETFPYVFSKPPSTTLVASNKPVVIPRTSPNFIDWECELCIVMGRRARHVSENDALGYVAGYTVVNDVSDRKFRPNPGRKERGNDKWFDWEHGKWHDTFCPCGPCIMSSDAVADPQKLKMKLTVNANVKQNATTGQQIFPVAAVVAFISDIVTLEPGDLISTGTPAGTGSASNTFLKAGDRMEAWIEGIGTLVSPVAAEG